MLVADVESRGVCAVEGGIHQLPEALATLAEENGVDLRYGSAVRRSWSKPARLRRRTREWRAYRRRRDHLNADAAALGAGLFGEQVSRAIPQVPARKRSHSVVTWNLLAKPTGFPMQYHNVFFPRDYAPSSRRSSRSCGCRLDPTVYICAQDRGNPMVGRTNANVC